MTRQVDVIARVSVLGANDEIETIQGTTIHPIWSVDRQDCVELSELQPGESLQDAAGIAAVLRVDIEQRSLPVYNIEAHNQHVYQIGKLALLVHNTCIHPGTKQWENAVQQIRNARKGTKVNVTVKTATEAKQLLREALGSMNRYKNYARAVVKYAKGFEMHNVKNAREAEVHTLQHIKWYANKTNGHIFFIKPN